MSRTRLSAKGPSLAEVCRWAEIDDSTRGGWANTGLVRQLEKDAKLDLACAVETVVVARMATRLTLDDVLIAWTAIGPSVTAFDSPLQGDRLDLVWFPSAPGEWKLATSDAAVLEAIKREGAPNMVVELGPAIGKAIRSFNVVGQAGWRRETGIKAAADRRKASGRGRNDKLHSDTTR